MCSYHGGKQRIGKQLAEVMVEKSLHISEDEGWTIKGYCEPFCGMLGVYHHIPELYEKAGFPKGPGLTPLIYNAGDANKSVIMMWEAAKNGWEPPTTMTEKRFDELKDGPDSVDSAEKGFVGHQYSFGGQYFKGYIAKYGKAESCPQSSERVKAISRKLSNVVFQHGCYTQYSNLKGYVIYCDPPYGNREQWYKTGCKGGFDSGKFFEWCRKMAEHNIVFVTEYEAPSYFEKIWTKTIKITGRAVSQKFGNGAHTKRVEKLFLVRPGSGPPPHSS